MRARKGKENEGVEMRGENTREWAIATCLIELRKGLKAFKIPILTYL